MQSSRVVLAVGAVIVALVVGNWLYWIADGGGSPADFRSRVNEAGLDVLWTNNGPSAGDGTIDTACGAVDVTVTVVDSELWVSQDSAPARMTDQVIVALLQCEPIGAG